MIFGKARVEQREKDMGQKRGRGLGALGAGGQGRRNRWCGSFLYVPPSIAGRSAGCGRDHPADHPSARWQEARNKAKECAKWERGRVGVGRVGVCRVPSLLKTCQMPWDLISISFSQRGHSAVTVSETESRGAGPSPVKKKKKNGEKNQLLKTFNKTS